MVLARIHICAWEKGAVPIEACTLFYLIYSERCRTKQHNASLAWFAFWAGVPERSSTDRFSSDSSFAWLWSKLCRQLWARCLRFSWGYLLSWRTTGKFGGRSWNPQAPPKAITRGCLEVVTISRLMAPLFHPIPARNCTMVPHQVTLFNQKHSIHYVASRFCFQRSFISNVEEHSGAASSCEVSNSVAYHFHRSIAMSP